MTRASMDEAQEKHSSELKYMDIEEGMMQMAKAHDRLKWLGNIGIGGLFVAGIGSGALSAGLLFPPESAVLIGAVVWTIGCGMIVYSILGR